MILLFLLSGVSLGIVVWQFLEGLRFPLDKPENRITKDSFPPITLLKPLKGVDEYTSRCLESWITQDYPGPIQLLLGVASSSDPVCELVHALQQKYPERNIQLILCKANLAINAKVSTLIQLENHIQHDQVIISDADVSVQKDFLRKLAFSYEDNPGLINCLYRLSNPTTLAMHMEAIAMNADFWSQVAQSLKVMEMDYAMGAVMATSRDWLAKIGGFQSVGDYLADDYQLGNQIHKQGGKIVLTNIIVDCLSPSMSWVQVWKHQLRWARTIRHCKPMAYALSILSNSTIWPVILTLCYLQSASWIFLLASLAVRSATAVWLQIHYEKTRRALLYFWLVPIKDIIQFVWWLLSFIGNRIEWRGEIYRVETGGKLVAL